MYLAGVSVRRVEDITEAPWGTKVSPGTISNLNKKVYEQIEAWRNRPIEEAMPYVYMDGIVLKRSWAGVSATSRFWRPSWSARRGIARSWASARGRRRTRPAGRAFWAI